jgi:hypothetical protein
MVCTVAHLLPGPSAHYQVALSRPPLQPYFTFVFPTCPLPLVNPDLRVFIDEGRIFILLNAISLLATIPLGMPNWGLLKRRGKLVRV